MQEISAHLEAIQEPLHVQVLSRDADALDAGHLGDELGAHRGEPADDGVRAIGCGRGTLAGGKRVEAVEDVLSVGQKVQVSIAEIDDRGKLSLVPVVEDDGSDADAEVAELTEAE